MYVGFKCEAMRAAVIKLLQSRDKNPAVFIQSKSDVALSTKLVFNILAHLGIHVSIRGYACIGCKNYNNPANAFTLNQAYYSIYEI